ncbi:membrane-spanning protein [Priestia megaterium]|uniref:Membrane-spanning protein n=2 Tax=Priestia megaterium TaxID=1404 RepID=A0A6M6E7V2_PRIMG|nr:membrane-spanning protein [Priestia megaterium]QJX81209.1 membrane-spanning protein [Priestia megaterium]
MKSKIILILSISFSVFMIFLLFFYLIKGDSSRWQVALGGVVVSVLPIFLLFTKVNPFPISLIVGYYIFLFSSLFLGSIEDFYNRFKWWDAVLHFYKGIFMGFVGISLYKLFIATRIQARISKWIIFLFVLSISVNATVLWEVYEFLGDLTFTHTMQSGGNTDTMYDIILGMISGLLTAIYSMKRREKL